MKTITIPAGELLYNRTGALEGDGWIHIVPSGELANPAADITQVLDPRAIDSIYTDLQNRQGMGARWPGLYFGAEHFLYDETQLSEAYGWGKVFERRADGIWCRPELTDLGETAIRNKRFQFTSFVCDPSKPGAAEKLGGKRVRILKIDTVGFTNLPNGRELLFPITNRSQPTREDLLAETRRWAKGELDTAARHFEKCYGMDRENAFNTARFFNRCMVRIAGIDQGEPEATTEEICKRFSVLINRYKAIKGGTFASAWNEVVSMEPEIYLAMVEGGKR